jgi:tRNA (guanine10-N2)-dimethyltransferase
MLTHENFEMPDNSPRLFFLLSGEHASLPTAEVLGILESENIAYSQLEKSYRLLKLNATAEALSHVSQRSLMYAKCGYLLGECEANENEIRYLIQSLPLDKYAVNASSYAVRSERLGGVNKKIRRVGLERTVGSFVKGNLSSLSVKLVDPDITFLCILYEKLFLFGILLHVKPSGPISLRRPRKRSVFHPATMPPKIARCMVNLSRARPEKSFADPFCGVGGIVIEAALIGCKVLALDASSYMLRGIRKNVKHFSLDTAGIIMGDARSLPFQELDAIATDPPYGRDSSTRGLRVNDLIRDFLLGAIDSLTRGAHLCISAPSEIDLEGYAQDAGFRIKERHLVRIHSSLTRQFIVAKKP